jgi:hypothetical protein
MRLRTFGLAAAALIGSGPLASGAEIVQTQWYGPQSTNWTNVSLNFPGFNTSLGTLTGLTVSATQITNGSLQNKNNGSSWSYVQSQLSNSWSVMLPGKIGGSTRLSGVVLSAPWTDYLAPGVSSLVHTINATGNAFATAVAGDNLSPYESPFVIKASDRGSLILSADNGNGQAIYTDLGEILVTVNYTYTVAVVPEPTTLAIIVPLLLGLALTRHYRG